MLKAWGQPGPTSACGVHLGLRVRIQAEDVGAGPNQGVVQPAFPAVGHAGAHHLPLVLDHHVPRGMRQLGEGAPAVDGALACKGSGFRVQGASTWRLPGAGSILSLQAVGAGLLLVTA